MEKQIFEYTKLAPENISLFKKMVIYGYLKDRVYFVCLLLQIMKK